MQFAGIRTTVGGEIEQLARANRGDYEKALTLSLEVAAKHVRAELIFPLVSHLQKPLENAGLGDENTRFLMEEELCELLIEPAGNKISELVRKLVTGHPTDALSELEPVFNLSPCRQRIVEFFSNFALGDLFSELYELDRNRTILEKQQLYLSFGDIKGSSASMFQRTAWRNADWSTEFVYSIVRADNPRSNIRA